MFTPLASLRRVFWNAAWALTLLLAVTSGAVGQEPYGIPAQTPARVLGTRYFGSHLHRLVPVSEPDAHATPWPVGQISALRLWDSTTRWADLEPSRGNFHFGRLDLYVAQARAKDAEVLMVLGSPPRWASERPDESGPYGPGSAAEPASLEDWDLYVTALAQRYKGRIKEYELWNEPYFSDLPADRNHPGAFFTGSVATMVELARHARAVLDREDPQAVLLTPGFVGSVQRLDMFLFAGGSRFVGGVAYHYYAEGDRDFIDLHHDIRAVTARHGVLQLPLYNTESGFAVPEAGESSANNTASRALAAALLARSMILGAFLGIDRFYQYAWDNDRSGMLFPRSRRATPSAEAFASVRRWLIGTTLQGCHSDAAGVVQCLGLRNGDQLSIWWRSSGATASRVQLPPHIKPTAAEYAVDHGHGVDLQSIRSNGVEVGDDPVAVWWRSPNEATPTAR